MSSNSKKSWAQYESENSDDDKNQIEDAKLNEAKTHLFLRKFSYINLSVNIFKILFNNFFCF